jgi:pSer/pThr/pTyr-binding forkhead associated (FHA) protein
MRFVILEGPYAGWSFPVDVETEVELGRAVTDVLADDPDASRRHAAVRPGEAGPEIEDLNSSNGTWVNGVRIERPTALSPGDVIRIGQLSMRVEA